MTGFNVAFRMRRDPLVAKYAKHLEPLELLRRSPVGDVTLFQSGHGVVIAFESSL
jgi:hypothetical protein